MNEPHSVRRYLPHGRPAWVGSDAVYFLTVCCRPRGENQLCKQSTAAVIMESVAFRSTRGDWHVHLLVLMPDHLHALVTFAPDRNMRRVISSWKETMAKRTGVRWQRDFFDHRLRNQESLEEKAAYIRMNPVRKGLIGDAADWPYIWEGGR